MEDGEIHQGDLVTLFHSNSKHEVLELGLLLPFSVPIHTLKAGNVGYVVLGCRDNKQILLGDTLYSLSVQLFLRPGGLLLVNSSLVHEREYRDDIKVVKVPMTEIAAEHENPKGANIVMMGAMAANSDLFTEDDLERLTNEFFEKKGKINPKNSLCFRAGTQIH